MISICIYWKSYQDCFPLGWIKKAACPLLAVWEPFLASLIGVWGAGVRISFHLENSGCLECELLFPWLLQLEGTTEQFAVYLCLLGRSLPFKWNYFSIIRSLQIHLTWGNLDVVNDDHTVKTYIAMVGWRWRLISLKFGMLFLHLGIIHWIRNSLITHIQQNSIYKAIRLKKK